MDQGAEAELERGEGFSNGGKEAEDRVLIVGEDSFLKLEESDRPSVDFLEEQFIPPFGAAKGEEGAPFSVGASEHAEQVVGVADPAAGIGSKQLSDIGALCNEVEKSGSDLSVGPKRDFCRCGEVGLVELNLCCRPVEPKLGQSAFQVKCDVLFIDFIPCKSGGDILDKEFCFHSVGRCAPEGGDRPIGGHEVVVCGEEVAFHKPDFFLEFVGIIILKQRFLSINFCGRTITFCGFYLF